MSNPPISESEQMDRLIDSAEIMFNRIVGRGYNEELAWEWTAALMIVSRLEVVAAEVQASYESTGIRLNAINECLAVTTLANVKAAMEMSEQTNQS